MNIVTKRFLSYLLDMFIIFIILFLIKQLLPVNNYEIELNNLNELYVEKKIDSELYLNQFTSITHNIDKTNFGINLFGAFLIIINFIIIPYLTKGQTIGQKIFKLKIKKKNLSIEDLAGRAVIINGLGYLIFMFIILFIATNQIYFILINLLGFLQILVVIINAFMVSYKREGIADKFTNTRIEEIKWENLQNKN